MEINIVYVGKEWADCVTYQKAIIQVLDKQEFSIGKVTVGGFVAGKKKDKNTYKFKLISNDSYLQKECLLGEIDFYTLADSYIKPEDIKNRFPNNVKGVCASYPFTLHEGVE